MVRSVESSSSQVPTLKHSSEGTLGTKALASVPGPWVLRVGEDVLGSLSPFPDSSRQNQAWVL